MNPLTRLAVLLAAVALTVQGCESRSAVVAGTTVCSIPGDPAVDPNEAHAWVPGHPDLSGQTRVGKASFYAQSFFHRVMANGHRMNPQGDNAASRTLPLGSKAKVVNLTTGQSAIVSIEDRGPYVGGRIVDLSPATARKIGITQRVGVAEVKVLPISVKMPDGTMKSGSGVRVPSCKMQNS